MEGFGAWLQLRDGHVFYLAGLWPVSYKLFIIADFELLAHIMAVTVLLPATGIQFRGLKGFVDNQNTLHWVNKLHCNSNKEGSWDDNSNRWRREWLIHRYALFLAARPLEVELNYINTTENVWADWLSRDELTKFLASCPSAQLVPIPVTWWQDWMPMPLI